MKNSISYTPLGGGREIGASSYHVMFGDISVLFDTGMRPGNAFDGLTPENAAVAQPSFDIVDNVHFIFVSHGHYDHAAGLMFAWKKFPDAQVCMTFITKELCRMHLLDMVRRMEFSRSWRGAAPLFTKEDVETLMSSVVEITLCEDGGEPLRLSKGLVVFPHRAGHIPGAMSVEFVYGEKSVIFTGDISWDDQHFTRGAAKFTPHGKVALLATEATYINTCFGKGHAHVRGNLVAAALETLSRGGNVLIPTLSIHRAQEIWMDFFEHRHIIPINRVFLDGGARRYVELFRRHIRTAKSDVLRFAQFVPRGWSGKGWEQEHHRRKLLESGEPLVVIASGAMLQEGSASYRWADMLISERKNSIFFTSFLDPCSVAHELLEQCRRDEEVMKLFGGRDAGGCKLRRFNLSAHTDRRGTEKMIRRLNPDVVVFNHGEPKEVLPYLEGVSGRDPGRTYLYPGTGEEVRT